MKSGVGTEAELIAGGSKTAANPELRRSFSEWARQLTGCRLCRNLTLAAFAAILTIEVAILIPSYRNYEEDLLRQRADIATQAIIMFLNSKSGQAVTPDRLEVL